MAGKADIVDHVASTVDGLTKKQASEAVDATFACIADRLNDGDRVSVPGFGSFSVSERAARKGRNPATGQEIQIAASKNARFKAGKDLKESLNS